MKPLIYIRNIFSNVAQVLFPDLCLACNREHRAHHSYFCTGCLSNLPFTDHFEIAQNEVTMHLRGRVMIHHGAALLTFKKENIVQHLLHQLKYKRRHEVGEILGKMAAIKFEQSPLFEMPDLIIPVPIHPKKEKKRGYNQSAVFGQSIGNYLNVICKDDLLIKVKETDSQTGKSRTERVENVADGFKVVSPELLKSKHILLVDDVITTGATTEACSQRLQEVGISALSVLCIAAAQS